MWEVMYGLAHPLSLKKESFDMRVMSLMLLQQAQE
jgi:hypothetical protein